MAFPPDLFFLFLLAYLFIFLFFFEIKEPIFLITSSMLRFNWNAIRVFWYIVLEIEACFFVGVTVTWVGNEMELSVLWFSLKGKKYV